VSHEGIKAGPLSPEATPKNDERLGKMLNVYPMGKGLQRLSKPEDIAPMVCLLASDRAAYITGQSIGISGGFVMI
jgi:NAD(P)-dependent dehydrogenase (short-subunit alcohol dehydrogenase family)